MPLGRSKARVGVGYVGEVPEAIWEVVRRAFEGGFAVSSNFAREHSTELALASSMGWVTTIHLDGLSYGRTWLATLQGAGALKIHLQSTYRKDNPQ